MAPKKMLTFPGSSCAPLVIPSHLWSETPIVRDYFWEQVDTNKTEAEFPFELNSSSSSETIPYGHQTPFLDHKEGEGVWVHPRSVMRMRVERGEVCWSDVSFEAKSQTSPSFVEWSTALMKDSVWSDAIISAGIGKALNLSKSLVVNRSPLDLEFLISRWSTESHTFVAAWGEFGPTLEDVVVLMGLPVFGEVQAVSIADDSSVSLDVDGEIRLTLLNEALVASKHKGKSTYSTWVGFFTNGPGVASEVRVEAMLSFWLSWYVLPSGPEDGLNAFVFPLAIRLARGEKIALAPIFLGSLFHRLDECVQSLVRSMGRYTVASYAQTAFLQLFLWEHFKSYGPQPVAFEASNMVMVEDENGVTRSVPDKPEKMRAQR